MADPNRWLRIARGRALPALLLAALAALWIAQFRPFVFPNNDFYSFRRAAWSLQDGRLPHSLKRGPILPGVIAALAPAMPAPQPELSAALVANLLFSLAMVAALWRFAAGTFPAAAPLFLVLLAATPVLHAMALQPLVEPSLGCFVALAFLGLRARSPWQYAAAGAAALSRPEAAALLGILALANGLAEGRWLRHVGLAALAAAPFVAWNAVGALRGSGATTYLELHHGFGGAALIYLVMLPKELFFGWWGRPTLVRAALLAALVVVPCALGARRALAQAPREAGALLAWLAVASAAVVFYGVGKARYLEPVLFVPLLCFAVGWVEIARAVERALGERAPRGAALAAAAACAAFALAAHLQALRRVTRATPFAIAPAPDLAFAALATALLAAACAALPLRRSAAGAAAALLVFAAAAPVVLGSTARKAELVAAVHDFDYAAAAAADWVAKNLEPGERAVVLHRSQVVFAAGVASDRIASFSQYDADSLGALHAALVRDGVDYAVYTWRRPPETRAERFYAERRNEALAALFASGAPLPGFEPVATLPAPERLGQPPAQVYRVLDAE